MCSTITAALILLVAVLSLAETPDVPRYSQGSVNDLHWLVGHWRGEGFGGQCEEIWSPPSGGTMVGTFKHYSGDTVIFYEIMVIERDTAGLALKLKHFNADLTGWEAKDEVVRFQYDGSSEDHVKFGGLTYTLISPNSLEIEVTVQQSDGTTSYETIACSRVE